MPRQRLSAAYRFALLLEPGRSSKASENQNLRRGQKTNRNSRRYRRRRRGVRPKNETAPSPLRPFGSRLPATLLLTTDRPSVSSNTVSATVVGVAASNQTRRPTGLNEPPGLRKDHFPIVYCVGNEVSEKMSDQDHGKTGEIPDNAQDLTIFVQNLLEQMVRRRCSRE